MLVLSMTAGSQVPAIPLVEVLGKLGAMSPKQIGSMGLNVGVSVGLIITVCVVVVAH